MQGPVTLLWVALWCCALLLGRRVAGQGLNVDYNLLGASARLQSQQSAYSAATARARQLNANYASSRRSCAGDSGSLCGTPLDTAADRAALLLVSSPQAYDARNRSHTGGFVPISPPKEQGDCNACVAFTLSAAAEAAIASALRSDAQQPLTPALSPRDIFFCDASGAPNDNDCQAGWTYSAAVPLLSRRSAIRAWSCLPFDAHDIDTLEEDLQGLCRASCSASSINGTFSYTKLKPLLTIEAVQAHIRDWGGVATRMNLPDTLRGWFAGANRTRVYDLPDPPNVERLSGHAVFVVGYDNVDQFWTIKNSWGDQWADKGFFKLKYGRLGIMDPSATYGITFRPASVPLPPLPPLLPAPKPGCYYYSTRPGDFASRIADTFRVPVADFISTNAPLLPDITTFLPTGRQLLVCNPRTGTPALPGGADDSAAAVVAPMQPLPLPSPSLVAAAAAASPPLTASSPAPSPAASPAATPSPSPVAAAAATPTPRDDSSPAPTNAPRAPGSLFGGMLPTPTPTSSGAPAPGSASAPGLFGGLMPGSGGAGGGSSGGASGGGGNSPSLPLLGGGMGGIPRPEGKK